MSRLSGLVTPELRAAIEAMLAKLAAPGACNPDDDTPVVDEVPDQDAVRRDHRSAAQRNHDGLLAGLRGLLASGKLGQHNGPAGVDHRDHDAQGPRGRHRQGPDRRGHPGAHVGRDPLGQPRPPLPGDLRPRQSPGAVSHETASFPGPANHALRQGTWLHHAGLRRTGLPQPGPPRPRLDQTPTAPTSTTSPWPADRDNRLVEKGWTTRTNAKGDTEWIPPPHLDYGRPSINTFHHPEKLLRIRRRRTRLTSITGIRPTRMG